MGTKQTTAPYTLAELEHTAEQLRQIADNITKMVETARKLNHKPQEIRAAPINHAIFDSPSSQATENKPEQSGASAVSTVRSIVAFLHAHRTPASAISATYCSASDLLKEMGWIDAAFPLSLSMYSTIQTVSKNGLCWPWLLLTLVADYCMVPLGGDAPFYTYPQDPNH